MLPGIYIKNALNLRWFWCILPKKIKRNFHELSIYAEIHRSLVG